MNAFFMIIFFGRRLNYWYRWTGPLSLLIITIIVAVTSRSSFVLATAFKPSTSLASSRSMSNSSSHSGSNDGVVFGRFQIPESHTFYRSDLSTAFVNLRPIVPGHILVISNRIVTTLADLTEEEYTDLWKTVRKLQPMLRELYHTNKDLEFGFNVAVQDGVAAGQTVPHVHVHILPRIGGDIERNDDVYQALEEWAPRDAAEPRQSTLLEVAEDSERRDRTTEEMAEEAGRYRSFLNGKSE